MFIIIIILMVFFNFFSFCHVSLTKRKINYSLWKSKRRLRFVFYSSIYICVSVCVNFYKFFSHIEKKTLKFFKKFWFFCFVCLFDRFKWKIIELYLIFFILHQFLHNVLLSFRNFLEGPYYFLWPTSRWYTCKGFIWK